jgi:hypothetical protein
LVVMGQRVHIDHKAIKCINCVYLVAKKEWKVRDFIREVIKWQEYMWHTNMVVILKI